MQRRRDEVVELGGVAPGVTSEVVDLCGGSGPPARPVNHLVGMLTVGAVVLLSPVSGRLCVESAGGATHRVGPLVMAAAADRDHGCVDDGRLVGGGARCAECQRVDDQPEPAEAMLSAVVTDVELTPRGLGSERDDWLPPFMVCH